MAGKAGQRVAEPRKLHIKDIATIVGALSLVAGVFGWVHSQVTIPQILQQTHVLIEHAIDRHAVLPHPVSVSKENYKRDVDRLFQRLDRQEVLLQRLVAGN